MIDLYTDNLLNDKLEFEFFCSEFSAYKFLELANEEIKPNGDEGGKNKNKNQQQNQNLWN